ncbi:YcxB family protein [Papillibacter cinnamivorans]|uniref:YcxB-like protein n=1 Tax=Papillibacter cinnamivorans DSM 12816 TaxID=1122930 RepID=A0A1W2BRZ1_9FIRM|nr:YcxB family protein [Papillibacter cinnamivorans]SMC75372.1 YcxB-like protein [Papillibacter cinnamivorans DSM 12816]
MADKEKDILEIEVPSLTRGEYIRSARSIFWFFYSYLVMIFLLFAYWIDSNELWKPYLPVPSFYFFLGALVFLPLVFEAVNRFFFDKLASPKTPRVFRFTPDGWSVRWQDREAYYTWEKTAKLRNDPEALYFFPTARTCYVLPKRLLTNKDRGKILRTYEKWHPKTKGRRLFKK